MKTIDLSQLHLKDDIIWIKKHYIFAISVAIHLILLFFIVNFFINDKINDEIYEITTISIISDGEYHEINRNNNKNITKSSKNSQKLLNYKKRSLKTTKNDVSNNISTEIIDNKYQNIIANRLEFYKSYIDLEYAPNVKLAKVVIKIRLSKNGKLEEYRIIEDSGYRFFDKSAIKIIELASPFPNPPKKLLASKLEFIIPILFKEIL